MKKRTSIIPLIIITMPSMIIGMWLFQKLKLAIYPTITIGHSHAITLIFTTILATVVAYFIGRKREVLLSQLIEEIKNREQSEEALQKSEEQYRRIVETAYEGIWTLDAEMRITYLNRRMAEIFGCRIEEMMGCPLFEFYDEEVQELVMRRLERHRQGISEQFDLRAHRKDGSELWTLVNASPIMDSDNKFIGLLGMSTDITKRKLAEIALQHQRELLRDLSSRLSEVEENERKRLAAELHDLVGQNLTALGINLNIIFDMMPADALPPVHSRMHDSLVMVNNTIESIRNVITDLRPSTMDDFGLTATIRWYGEKFLQLTGIAMKMHIAELCPRLPAQTENTLFRIFQEALVNVQKHAQATEVTVSLQEGDNHVRLLIDDNGVGFDAASADKRPEKKSWGLVIMAERSVAAGGRFSIRSRPGQGTQIAVEVKR